MRTLLLMRHAKSDWGDHAVSDHDRVLNARGRGDAPEMAQHLASMGLSPGSVISSTAARTRETVERMLPEFAPEPTVRFDSTLYLAEPSTLVASIASTRDDVSTLLVVAHNPGIGTLASMVAGRDLAFPTAAVGAFEFEVASWSGVAGTSSAGVRCLGIWLPRELN